MCDVMNSIRALQLNCLVVEETGKTKGLYPYLRSEHGDKTMWQVSPIHGRSYVVGRTGESRYVVSKGNGLGYTQYNFVYTTETPEDIWGLLLKEDALRDFHCGQEVQALGIKTNQMECVLELDYPIHITKTNVERKPVLLQYNVECPYRISDAPFMTREKITNEVNKWERMNDKGFDKDYLIAANVLIRNLRIMHDHEVLHNAIHEQNYTWALELLDFELCRTPNYPYTQADYERHVCNLYDREVIQTYQVIIYIAGCLNEPVDFKQLDNLFLEYGFDLRKFKL